MQKEEGKVNKVTIDDVYIFEQEKKLLELTKNMHDDFRKYTEEMNQKKLDVIQDKNKIEREKQEIEREQKELQYDFEKQNLENANNKKKLENDSDIKVKTILADIQKIMQDQSILTLKLNNENKEALKRLELENKTKLDSMNLNKEEEKIKIIEENDKKKIEYKKKKPYIKKKSKI